MGTGSLPRVKRPGRGVDHPLHMTPRLKNDRAIPLLPLWAFVAFSRETFTFTFTTHKKQFDNVACIRVLYKNLLRKILIKVHYLLITPVTEVWLFWDLRQR